MRTLAERERLFNDNENLAFSALNEWMRRYKGFVERYRLERDDLESVALLALWTATEKWNPKHLFQVPDPARGQFSTLATLLVYSKLSHVLIPFTRIKRGSGETTVSLDAPVAGSDSLTQADLLIAPLDDNPEVLVLRQEESSEYGTLWAQAIRDESAGVAVNTLRPNRARAVRACVCDELTQVEAAARLGVSRQSVSQSVQSGIAELRELCADMGLPN